MDAQKELFSHREQVEKKLKAQFGEQAPKVWVTMLYGSQNYGLSTADSDVDTKTMVLPSFDSVVRNTEMLSEVVEMEDGSLDTCKDFRSMFDNYKKGNINFVETLYTPFVLCSCYFGFFDTLRSERELVSNSQPKRLMHMAAGMVQQKDVAFNKPFAGKLEVLEKYGYDPKQLHHMVRLQRFMEVFMETGSFNKALDSSRAEVDQVFHDYVMGLKSRPLCLSEAEDLRLYTRNEVKKLLDKSDSMPDGFHRKEALEFLDDLQADLMRVHLRSVLAV